MRVFGAQLLTETNTFAPIGTGRAAFEAYGIYRGNASTAAPTGTGSLMRALSAACRRDGHEFLESLAAMAQPSGRTAQDVYEEFKHAILEDLDRAGDVSLVVLILHGAMVADQCDDCEGDLIAAIRERLGPNVPIVASLDLHAHLTAQMLDHATALVAFKEYPHTDVEATVVKAYEIGRDAALGVTQPRMVGLDCGLLGLWRTTDAPMNAFVQSLRNAEAESHVLSVSLIHGFPWGDVADVGARVCVVVDEDVDLACRIALSVKAKFLALQADIVDPNVDYRALIEACRHTDKRRIVIADVADNPGGGAPGDSGYLLEALIQSRMPHFALGAVWDPGAIALCKEAGEGAWIDLRIGGKCSRFSGPSVELRVRVVRIVEEHCQAGLGGKDSLGCSVWVQGVDHEDILIAERRTQIVSMDAFTGIGIDLESKRVIVVKSTQHFHASFSSLATQIYYAATPGALNPDFTAIPYTRRRLPDGENQINWIGTLAPLFPKSQTNCCQRTIAAPQS